MGRRRQGQRREQSFTISKSDQDEIIVNGNTTLLVERAGEAGKAMHQYGLNANQFRAIFGMLRQIQSIWYEEDDPSIPYRKLQMLKPKIAYQAARNPQVKILLDILVPAIDTVGDDWHRFQNFMDFVEASLAYFIEANERRN